MRIDGRIYLTYVAFEGWDHVHMAVTSISEKDLKSADGMEKAILSFQKSASKNWVLFPEKFNGKFAIIHGIVDKVMIEYVMEPRLRAAHKEPAKSRRSARIQSREQKKVLGLLHTRRWSASVKDRERLAFILQCRKPS